VWNSQLETNPPGRGIRTAAIIEEMSSEERRSCGTSANLLEPGQYHRSGTCLLECCYTHAPVSCPAVLSKAILLLDRSVMIQNLLLSAVTEC
jgi:hypothetical protein